jgi:hypothetical protein
MEKTRYGRLGFFAETVRQKARNLFQFFFPGNGLKKEGFAMFPDKIQIVGIDTGRIPGCDLCQHFRIQIQGRGQSLGAFQSVLKKMFPFLGRGYVHKSHYLRKDEGPKKRPERAKKVLDPYSLLFLARKPCHVNSFREKTSPF